MTQNESNCKQTSWHKIVRVFMFATDKAKRFSF